MVNSTLKLLFFVSMFSVSLLTTTGTTFAYTVGSIHSTIKITAASPNGVNTVRTIAVDDRYGVDMANIGDLDGDGNTDILIGANGDDDGGFNKGAAYIHFMNTDGSIKSTIKLNGLTTNGAVLSISDYYGVAVEGIGDLNNDGVPDIAIGANGDDAGGAANTNRGGWYIHYMNRDGSIISTVKISPNTPNGPTAVSIDDRYGYRIANLGDLDGDGINDIAVSVVRDDTGGTDRGAFYIHYMNRDGSIKSSVKINGATPNGATLANVDKYSNGLANIGDLDGDGINDIAVGTYADDTGGTNRGAWYIHYMNRDGSIKSTVKINHGTANGATLVDGDYYGAEITNIGDLDGDGIGEIAVGVEQDDTGGTNRGAMYIHYMNRNGSIKSSVKITSSTTNGPQLINNSYYSEGVVLMGDLNKDGSIDMAVSAYGDSSYTGAWYLHFLTPTPGVSVSKINIAVTEDGVNDSYTLALQSRPTDDVTVSFASENSRVGFSPSAVTFTSQNWDSPQTVTISAVNDNNTQSVESDRLHLVISSADSIYNAFSVPPIPVSIAEADIVAPSIPTGITAEETLLQSIVLSWNPSTDDQIVVGYTVYRDTIEIGSSTTSRYTDTNLKTGTAYTYTISAYDAIPNTSSLSSPLTITTLRSSSSGGYIPSKIPLQLGTTVVVPITPSVPIPVLFTTNLSTGMRSDDVRKLQQFLNAHGYTVTTSGPGSVGNETNFFGRGTRLAVVRFQKAVVLTPVTGYVGPLTRGIMNKMLQDHAL